MNKYKLKDLKVGMKASFDVVITSEMQTYFQKISGDINPLHTDEEYAVQNNYLGKVVYGMLTASLYSKLVGVYMPGKYCLLQECKISFRSPVYILDKLTIVGTVKEIYNELNRITVKAEIINQNGKKVSNATLDIGLLN